MSPAILHSSAAVPLSEREIRPQNLPPLSVVNKDTVLGSILNSGQTTTACSKLHDLVHAFRRAHGLTEEDLCYKSERYVTALSQYSVSNLLASEAKAVKYLSTPAVYANMRHGGRLESPYPPLSDAALSQLSKEIKAALIWSTFRAAHAAE